MFAVVGVLLLSASIFGAVFGALLFRNPHRAGWARTEWLSDMAALVLVGLFAFGTASFLSFALTLPEPTGWFVGAAGILGTFALGWGAWRGLHVGQRLAAFDQEAEAIAIQGRRSGQAEIRIASSADRSGQEPPVRPKGAGGAGGRKSAA